MKKKKSPIMRIKNAVLHPKKIAIFLLRVTSRLWSDGAYLKALFWLSLGYKLDLRNPKTFNEKLQWLKIYNRKEEYTLMVDKVEAKKYVASVIGEEYIIPTLAVYNRAEEIDFDALPNQFVLKCTHDSGGIVICKDKTKIDKEEAIRMLRKGLKRNYYWQNREWPYKNVKPRIIAEQYMADDGQGLSDYSCKDSLVTLNSVRVCGGGDLAVNQDFVVHLTPCQEKELHDYKFFCFDGKPKVMFVASERYSPSGAKFNFYDMDFNLLPFTNGHPNYENPISKPAEFEKMKELAAKLSRGTLQVRIDFYDVNGHIYFGEITFYHWSGMTPFVPEEWDYKLGQLIKLPEHNSEE